MSNSRGSKSNKRRPFLKFIQWILMIIGLLAIFYLLYINFRPKPNVKINIPQVEISQRDSTGLDSAKLSLSQATVNKMIKDLIETMPQNPMGLQMAWQQEKVLGNLNINYRDNIVPASFTAVPSVESNQLILTFESINLSGIPLPIEEAYSMIAGGITLPEGFYFNSEKPVVTIDVNQLAGLNDPNFVQAKAIDMKAHELVVEVFFDPEQHLLNIGN